MRRSEPGDPRPDYCHPFRCAPLHRRFFIVDHLSWTNLLRCATIPVPDLRCQYFVLNKKMPSTRKLTYSISQVERDTGLTKDVLRVWERRYQFPRPGRDENGERVYEM